MSLQIATTTTNEPSKFLCMDRNQVIKALKAALKSRSGKVWSVTGGKGTAWGWITINAIPSRRTWKNIPTSGNEVAQAPGHENWVEINEPDYEFGHMGPDDRAELASLLGLERVNYQGHSIPASSAHYREALERAHGLPVTQIAQPYWD